MKKKLTAFVMAVALLCNCTMFSANNAVPEQIFVSAAVTNTVPEGYTPIYTIDDLYAVRNNLSGSYILMNDIDMSATAPGGDWDSGNGWKPIGGKGEDNFTGIFDGNGYAIKNMHIYGEIDNGTSVGLFGRLGQNSNGNGTILNLALLDCNIDITTGGTINYIGGVAGYDIGKNISKCFVTGNIKVTLTSNYMEGQNIGGITGYSSAKIENCYNSCSIITNTESITSSDYGYIHVGGVAGCIYSVNNTYNVGDITIITNNNLKKPSVGYISGTDLGLTCLNNCYYLKKNTDYTASGYASDNRYTNVVGLTAGQMKSKSTYTGFDFDTIWTIDSTAEYSYPTLRDVPYVSTGSSSQPATEPTTNPSSDSSLKGDINGDGKVNATDAAIILVYAAMTGAGHQVSIDDLY